VLAITGALTTIGCLLGLFLANLSFFGERPEVPVLHMVLLLAAAAAGTLIPVIVAALVLPTWRQKLAVAALMLTVMLLAVLWLVSMLGIELAPR
jgi:hypothetical protein